MACQLHARGHRIGLLTIIDQECPHGYQRYAWQPKWMLRFASNIPRWVLHDRHEWPAGKRYIQLRSKVVKVKDLFLALLRPSHLDLSNWGVDFLPDLSQLPERYRWILEANQKAMMAYQPGVYPGRITVVRASIRPLICTFEHDLGWGRHASGGVEVVGVPGYHNNIIKEPHVRSLAQRLREILRKADAENADSPHPESVC
jgi:thioesterase domain-containing protein